MAHRDKKLALITGASSGIGEVFARRLAARNYELALAARREERLAALKCQLEAENGIRVEALRADLSKPDDIERVERYISGLDRLDLLINNAGFGGSGNFINAPLDDHLRMIQVHVVASVRLTYAALPGMISRGSGSIINVSSVAAFTPQISGVTYSPTKVYLNHFSEALQAELHGSGVRVQALCPGFTHTGFHDSPELGKLKRNIPGIFWMQADQVVDSSLRALERGGGVHIPGLTYKLAVFFGRLGLFNLLGRFGVRRWRSG